MLYKYIGDRDDFFFFFSISLRLRVCRRAAQLGSTWLTGEFSEVVAVRTRDLTGTRVSPAC